MAEGESEEERMDPYCAIEALAKGGLRDDDAAANRLLECAWPVLSRRVLRHCWAVGMGNRSYLEDVIQDVLLEVWRCRNRYRGQTDWEFNGWFYRISWAKVCRAIATKTKQPRSASGFSTVVSDGSDLDHLDIRHSGVETHGASYDDPAGPAIAAEAKHALRECLEKLRSDNPAAYDVLALRLFAGMSNAPFNEIAEVLCRPRTTVQEQSSKGLQAMRRCLEGRGVSV